MKIDDMKLSDVLKLVSCFSDRNDNHPYEVGKNYLIRTVTNYFTGRLIEVTQ